MFDTKYVIARKNFGHATDYDYIITLAHEFAGMEEVVGYLPLKDAHHYDSQETAGLALEHQPLWIREKHVVVPFTDFGGYCQIDRAAYNNSL